MRPVRVVHTFAVSVSEAELCWYDTGRWPGWVDGLDAVLETRAPWPQVGGVVRWESGPAGRGRVVETVIDYTPADGQTVQVSDDTVTARQSVSFTAVPAGVEVTLELEYRITRRSPLTPLVDVLFVRRAMTQSLGRSLERFGLRLSGG
ncbi:MAG TPA: SRPBCC family protein [Solirubrobacteraceae bacterium]|nr:SRPBCC family protein [Solirubrobacteraceae bacterium]